MFGTLTIKKRLVFVMAFLSVQLLVGALIGITALSRANGAMASMYNDRVLCLAQLDTIIRGLNRNQVAMAQAALAEPDQIREFLPEIDQNLARVGATWKAYRATRLTEKETALADAFERARAVFLTDALMPTVKALRDGDRETAIVLLHGRVRTLFEGVRSNIDALMRLQQDVSRQAYEDSVAEYHLVRNVCIAGMALGLVLAAVVGVFLIRAISEPLDEAIQTAEAIAGGNLAFEVKVRSEDEMGRLMTALRSMQGSLAGIVARVRAGTDTIATASAQIASGNLDLSGRTENQASSLEETASSMEQLTSTVRQNADNARQANSLAQAASELAVRGGGVVAEVVQTMDSINQSSNKIVDIIGVIDGIAFQTNILALNAAVEAARAGEQGRGFAVVASEVRNLAQRSAAAAKEIKALIDDSVGKVQDGARQVDQAGSTMTQIVDSIKRVADIMAEITAATGEQTAGIEQVNTAITQMDEATQQNASLVEEAAAAASAMQDQAAELARLVGIFQIANQSAGRARSLTLVGS